MTANTPEPKAELRDNPGLCPECDLRLTTHQWRNHMKRRHSWHYKDDGFTLYAPEQPHPTTSQDTDLDELIHTLYNRPGITRDEAVAAIQGYANQARIDERRKFEGIVFQACDTAELSAPDKRDVMESVRAQLTSQREGEQS